MYIIHTTFFGGIVTNFQVDFAPRYFAWVSITRTPTIIIMLLGEWSEFEPRGKTVHCCRGCAKRRCYSLLLFREHNKKNRRINKSQVEACQGKGEGRSNLCRGRPKKYYVFTEKKAGGRRKNSLTPPTRALTFLLLLSCVVGRVVRKEWWKIPQ